MDCEDNNSAKLACGAGGCCTLLLIGLTLLLVSYDSLEVDETGLDYSSRSKTIDPKPYTEGIYMLGLGHSFIRFPNTLQHLGFHGNHKIMGRTEDGFLVKVEASFQYRMVRDEVFDLYSDYGTQYGHIYDKMARAKLVEICRLFGAYDFFTDRQAISNAMHVAIADLFRLELHAVVEFFQLQSVDLPDEFEQAIEDTNIAAQSIERVRNELETTRVEMRTQVVQAQYQGNITTLTAKAMADSITLQASADVDIFLLSQKAKAQSYKAVKDGAGFDSSQLLEYVRLSALQAHQPDQLTIGLTGMTT